MAIETIRNFTYKLYISKNTRKLDNLIISSNFAWNHIIKITNRFYRMFHKGVSNVKLQSHMAKLRKRNEFWKKLDAQTLQDISQKYKIALDNHFNPNMKSGFPRRHKCFDGGSIKFKQNGYSVISSPDGKTGFLFINSIDKRKPFKFKITRLWHKIRNIIIKKGKNHSFYLTICCETPVETYKRIKSMNVGIDFGFKTFLTTSDGELIDYSDTINKSYDNISECQKYVSYRQNAGIFGSSYKRARKNLSRAYDRFTNKRVDEQWKLAHSLCKMYSLIAIENLCLKGMAKRGEKKHCKRGRKRFGKKVSMMSFGSFVQKLEVVAFKYGTKVVKIDRFYPSSQLCHVCGYQNPEVKNLSIRNWTCPECGTNHDRDVNAAINILNIAIADN